MSLNYNINQIWQCFPSITSGSQSLDYLGNSLWTPKNKKSNEINKEMINNKRYAFQREASKETKARRPWISRVHGAILRVFIRANLAGGDEQTETREIVS